MRRISTLYQNSSATITDSFEINPPSGHRAVGLLITPGVEVSLAFNGGSDLKLHRYRSDYSHQGAPKNRIIPLDEPLKGSIKGVVNLYPSYSNREQHPQVSIYLISQAYES